MEKKRNRRLIVWCILFLLSPAFPLAADAQGQSLSRSGAADLKGNPALFSNASFLMRQFDGFDLGNQVIEKAVFEKVTFRDAVLTDVTFTDCDFTSSLFQGGRFTNVRFIDCRFIESQFSGIVFDTVSFIGGKIAMLRPHPGDTDYVRELFGQQAFTSIENRRSFLLDNVALQEAAFASLSGGRLILKNMSDFSYSPKVGKIVDGRNIILRIENSSVSGVRQIARVDASSHVFIVDSVIEGGVMDVTGKSDAPAKVSVTNSDLRQGFSIGGAIDTLDVHNSAFDGRLEADTVFVSSPRWLPPSEGSKGPFIVGRTVSVAGNDARGERLSARINGSLSISDLTLDTLSVSGHLDALNLSRMKMTNLHFDDGVTLNGGVWRKVDVSAPMRAASPGKYSFNGPVSLYETALHGGKAILDCRSSCSDQTYLLETRESHDPPPVPSLSDPGLHFPTGAP